MAQFKGGQDGDFEQGRKNLKTSLIGMRKAGKEWFTCHVKYNVKILWK